MSSTDTIANIYKFSNEYNEELAIVESITELNPSKAIESFKTWAHKLVHKKFQIVSFESNFIIVFIIYSKAIDDKLIYIITVDIIFDEIACTSTYKIDNKLQDIDIDNMSDIVSIFIKICNKDIVNYNKKTIMDLFELRMTTIATKV